MGIPSLKYINLENTEIGKYTCIEEETKQAYDQFQSHKMSAANLFINLSNNHFENDMLIQWTWLWKKLKRLSKLEIASVTSDFGWENFEALSDLPTLSDLSFKYSIRETLNNCRLYEFFKLKPRLNQLDLTACGLALDDMVTLSYSLEFVSKMRRLTLNSNPKIGDQGVKLLNNVIEKRKIDILDISDCQLVHLSIYLKWTGYLKQINMTKNPKLSFATREEEMAIENQLCNSHLDTLMAMIKLDNHLKLNLSSKIQSMISLSYQPSLGHLAVNSPFDDDD
ncbi:uncharacterized protein BX663DRAFT_525246, partial [Cokeromyces recurvatus]|uniref:uncharacterized protein n=1 Tax=Cokeromyces recurvatus TaxID=90255 RepID=UPI0022200931